MIFNFTFTKMNSPAKNDVMQPHTTALHTVQKLQLISAVMQELCT